MKNVIKLKFTVVITLVLLFLLLPSTLTLAAGKPSLNEKSFTLFIGKTFDLNIKNVAKGATSQWTSSDTKIATVNKNGLVKSITKGTAKITCKVKSSGVTYNLTAAVTVIEPAKSVKIQNENVQLMVGDTIKMKYVLSPGTSNDIVSWQSSNEAVVKPDDKGNLIANAVGYCEVTAVTLSGVKDSIPVEVEDAKTMLITYRDLDSNNSVVFADTALTNIYISNSVGNAKIKFDRCTVSGTLTIEAGVEYKIEAENSTIQACKSITPGYISNVAKDEKRPTLYIGDTTAIKDTLLSASCYLELSKSAQIDKIQIAPKVKGDYEMLVTGYQGDIEVNYDTFAQTRLELAGCNIDTVNINKTNGYYFTLTSNTDQLSTIDTVNLKSEIMTALDAKINVVNIDKSLSDVKLIVGSPINKLVHYGSTISIQVCEDAFIAEIVDKLSADHSYGNYNFSNWDYGEFAFTLKVKERIIESIRLKDFEKILQVWTDTTKPFEVPEEKGVIMTCITKDTYQFDFNGPKVNLGIFFDQGAVKVYGGEDITISNIGLAKEKNQ